MTSTVRSAFRVLGTTDLDYYSGDDTLLLPYLAIGAAGVVSIAGHLVGRELADTIRHFQSGDLGDARVTYRGTLPLIDLVCATGNGALRVKLMLHMLGMISAAMRLPHAPADITERQEVRDALVAAYRRFYAWCQAMQIWS